LEEPLRTVQISREVEIPAQSVGNGGHARRDLIGALGELYTFRAGFGVLAEPEREVVQRQRVALIPLQQLAVGSDRARPVVLALTKLGQLAQWQGGGGMRLGRLLQKFRGVD